MVRTLEPMSCIQLDLAFSNTHSCVLHVTWQVPVKRWRTLKLSRTPNRHLLSQGHRPLPPKEGQAGLDQERPRAGGFRVSSVCFNCLFPRYALIVRFLSMLQCSFPQYVQLFVSSVLGIERTNQWSGVHEQANQETTTDPEAGGTRGRKRGHGRGGKGASGQRVKEVQPRGGMPPMPAAGADRQLEQN